MQATTEAGTAFNEHAQRALQQALVDLYSYSPTAQLPKDINHFIVQYRYKHSRDETLIEFSFDKQAIKQWLSKQNADSHKDPHTTLLLVATQQHHQRTYWLTPDEKPQLFGDLQRHARSLGLTVVTPMMDLTDMEILTSLSETDNAALLMKRYGTNGLLKSDLTHDDDNDKWLSHWLLKTPSDQQFFDANASSIKGAMTLGLDQVSKRLSDNTVQPKHIYYLQQHPPPESNQEMSAFVNKVIKMPNIEHVVLDSVTASSFLYKITARVSIDELVQLLVEHNVVSHAYKGTKNQIIVG